MSRCERRAIAEQSALGRLGDGGVNYLSVGLNDLTADWDLLGTLQLAGSGTGSRALSRLACGRRHAA